MGGGGDYLDSSAPKSAEKRLKEGYECTDWHFCKKDLPDMTGEKP